MRYIFYAVSVKHLNLVLEVTNYNIQTYMHNYQMNSTFVENLQARLDVYDKFRECIKRPNEKYFVFLLFVLFSNIISSFVNSYFVIFEVVFVTKEGYSFSVLLFTKRCIKSIFCFYILVNHMANLAKEVSSTNNIYLYNVLLLYFV